MIKIPRVFRNFYVASALGVLVWLLFFELNGIITQIKNEWRLHELKAQKKHYEQQIEELKKEQFATLGSDKLMEKYAREKYYMKKDSEDVFVLVDEKGEPFEK